MRLRGTRREVLLLAVFALLGLGWSVLIPMWEAPDETNHYLVALHVARHGTHPPAAFNAEAHQPPAFYRLAGGLLWLVDRIDPALNHNHRPPPPYGAGSEPRFRWTAENYRFLWGPQLVRWLGIAVGMLTLHCLYLGARELVPDDSYALACTAMAGLTPQFIHICASISNDPLAYLAGALLFALASRLASRTASKALLATTVPLALVLPFTVKLSVLPLSALALLVAAWRAIERGSADTPRGRVTAIALGALAVLLVLAAVSMWAPEVSAQLWRRATHVRDDAFLHFAVMTRRFLTSYWGLAGWMATPLPARFVRLLCGLAGIGLASAFAHQLLGRAPLRAQTTGSLLATAGALLLVVLLGPWPASLIAVVGIIGLALFAAPAADDSGRLPDLPPVDAARWLWVGLGIALAVFFKNFLSESFGVQARFLFPAIGLIAALTVAGWRLLLRPRWHDALAAGIATLLVAANLTLWITGIAPKYYQPLLG